ncbi:MAG: hypothetical protein LUD27_04975 [Clostridia bacterium]|nr:hypothetical protein [Clostridia bacterium]
MDNKSTGLNESREERRKSLAEDVTQDFLRRQRERKSCEAAWRLNMNFLNGKQYCGINSACEIEDEQPSFYWQPKRVFNHIAPTIDLRCAKLSRVRPALCVYAATGEEADLNAARLASAVLSAACEKVNMTEKVSDAIMWSETCGTSFYKVIWDNYGGNEVGLTDAGEKLYEGDVKVTAISPFEIYPYSLDEESLEAQPSLIHARAVPVTDIYAAYGVRLAGRDKGEFAYSTQKKPYKEGAEDKKEGLEANYELVIERYERPSADFPDGRFTVVAGGQLLYDGILPYKNGDGGGRIYPFIKQTSVRTAGKFFGSSVIERMIPVQRAYNAVRNRKHEFLNRISVGSIAVEDGSVDTDELIEDGLRPGKVIVYRQGGKPPEMLSLGSVPEAFGSEEELLQDEFSRISGTGDLTQSGDKFSSVTSATGLQLLIEEDESRLTVCYESIKSALKLAGKHILRLYRQFATDARLLKTAGENGALKLYCFKGSDISSDDVVLESDSELNLTPAERRAVVYDLIEKGLLDGDDGKMSRTVKNRVLKFIGYEKFAGERDLSDMHSARAGDENIAMRQAEANVKEYDDHAIHIREHTAFLLSDSLDEVQEARICSHIKIHRQKLKEEQDG